MAVSTNSLRKGDLEMDGLGMGETGMRK
jgi:hypothetical protein